MAISGQEVATQAGRHGVPSKGLPMGGGGARCNACTLPQALVEARETPFKRGRF